VTPHWTETGPAVEGENREEEEKKKFVLGNNKQKKASQA